MAASVAVAGAACKKNPIWDMWRLLCRTAAAAGEDCTAHAHVLLPPLINSIRAETFGIFSFCSLDAAVRPRVWNK